MRYNPMFLFRALDSRLRTLFTSSRNKDNYRGTKRDGKYLNMFESDQLFTVEELENYHEYVGQIIDKMRGVIRKERDEKICEEGDEDEDEVEGEGIESVLGQFKEDLLLDLEREQGRGVVEKLRPIIERAYHNHIERQQTDSE